MTTTADMCSLLHPSYCKEKNTFVLKFFGDESGISKNSRICTVAGLFGNESQWKKFDREWLKVLKRYDIPYFHAVDCERGTDDFYGLDVSRRGHIADELVAVILSSPIQPFGYGVVVPDFTAWDIHDRTHFTKGHPDTPYYLCLEQIFVGIGSKVSKLPLEEQVHFIFEQQDEFEFEAKKIFSDFKNNTAWPNHVRLGKCCFEKEKDKYPGIQAADLLAYEAYRHLDNKHFHPELKAEWKVRSSMSVLRKKIGDYGRYFDAAALTLLGNLKKKDYET